MGDEHVRVAQHGQLREVGPHLHVAGHRSEVAGVDPVADGHRDLPHAVAERLEAHPEEPGAVVERGPEGDEQHRLPVGDREPAGIVLTTAG